VRPIWFKPFMVEQLRGGRKWTTFRTRRHEGTYQVVRGSWFKPVEVGLVVELTPMFQTTANEVIFSYYLSEGFTDPQSFLAWVRREKLTLGVSGWLHRVKIVKDEKGSLKTVGNFCDSCPELEYYPDCDPNFPCPYEA